MSFLFIVENNTKKQTFDSALYEKHKVLSTAGSIKKEKIGNKYVLTPQSRKYLENIKEEASKSDKVFLAMDDDDNGEKIAWDTLEYLYHEKVKTDYIYRITPREITLDAILDAVKSARRIDKKTITAQITKKRIEKMVSRDINKIMRWWFKKENLIEDDEILADLGVGMVSAAALSLVMSAEEKIDTFIPQKYKRVRVNYFHNNAQFRLTNSLKFTEEKTEELLNFVNRVSRESHIISDYEEDTKDILPPHPLNTTWLQREANYQLSFSPKETMSVAKKLYEGIEVEEKRVGLITYFKTSSFYICDDAVYKIMHAVQDIYGEKYLFQIKREYKNQANTTQEAIRPVSFEKKFYPQNLRKYFSSEKEYILYEYIFNRTIATQMSAAVYDNSILKVEAGGGEFKAIANTLIFDGWEIIGQYWKNEDTKKYDPIKFPDEGFIIGSEIKPINVETYPPAPRQPWRYGIGRFITSLEKYNIATPSFIAEVLNFLEEKGFITIEKNKIRPTLLARWVYGFLALYTPWLIDLDTQEKLISDLKLVESGELNGNDIVEEYENYKNETIMNSKYVEEKILPDDWVKQKALKIAKQRGQTLNEDMLSNNKVLMHFISQNKEDITDTFGQCPSCGKGEIFKNDYGYKCNNPKCNFMLWDKSVKRFLENFSKYIPDYILPKYIEIILKKGKCYIDNLYNGKKNSYFNAFVALEYNEKYKSWQLSFFNNKKTDETDIQNFIPVLQKNEVDQIEKLKLEKDNEKLQGELEKEREERRLVDNQSKKDPLTRAFNRGSFDKDIAKFFNGNQWTNLACAFIDGDKFKNVNDTYGHQTGDSVLQFLVNEIHKKIKELERVRVYRYGGEEFIILFANMEKTDVLSCVNDIRKSIEEGKVTAEDGRIVKMTISAGVSFREKEDTSKSLVEKADKAVYIAKESGRNRIEIA